MIKLSKRIFIFYYVKLNVTHTNVVHSKEIVIAYEQINVAGANLQKLHKNIFSFVEFHKNLLRINVLYKTKENCETLCLYVFRISSLFYLLYKKDRRQNFKKQFNNKAN